MSPWMVFKSGDRYRVGYKWLGITIWGRTVHGDVHDYDSEQDAKIECDRLNRAEERRNSTEPWRPI